MLRGYSESAGASIDFGDAADLFPVDDLDARVLQHRDAELALADVNSADVIVVAPTSLASSYFLTQHPPTALPTDSLPPAVRTSIGETVAAPIETFDLIQIGKWTTDSPNHSLAEFTTA